jgi:hypothetical protein
MTRDERRRRIPLPPQRLPDGRIRCENGGASPETHCPEPAAWLMAGATIRTPGAVACNEHRVWLDQHSPFRAREWIHLDNPPYPDVAGIGTGE